MNYEITRTDFFYVMANLKTMMEENNQLRGVLKVSEDWVCDKWIDKYLDLLLRPFNERQRDLIEIYIYDYDFGHNYHRGMIKDDYGTIKLRTASDLWEYINGNPVYYKDPPEI